MSLTGEAIAYLQQQYPGSSFLKDIILQDDGNGPYIKYWGIGSPAPSEAELNAAAQSMIPKPARPSDSELIEMLYNDKKNNTDTFVKAIDESKGIK